MKKELSKICFDQTFFLANICFVGPKLFLDPKFFWTQTLFLPTCFQFMFMYLIQKFDKQKFSKDLLHLVTFNYKIGTSVRHSSGWRSAGRLLAMTEWPLFPSVFSPLLFSSAVTFSHRRSARIKKLI